MYGRTVKGQGIVDSGANFWAWQKGVRKLMSNTIDHESKVIGYDGKAQYQKMTAGEVYVLIPGVNSEGEEVIGGFHCSGKAIDAMSETLIPVYKLVEEQGFTLLIQPKEKGDSYFYKGDIKLPIENDETRGLYTMDYVIAESKEAAKRACRNYRFVPVHELRPAINEEIIPFNIAEPIAEEEIQDESDEVTSENLFREWESIASASVRRGLRILSKKQMHEKLLHTGEAGNCSVCKTLRRGRPHDKLFRRVLDPKPGRTINIDILTWSERGEHGEKYSVVMIDDKSDHLWNIELTKKSEFKEAFIKWLIDARRDPEYGRSDLVLVVRLDNAGEWGREFEGFHEACKDRLNPVPYFAYQGTMVDSRYNGKAEMAVRMVEEMTKAVMLTTSIPIEQRPRATKHAIEMFNLMLRKSKAGPTGHGVRPLQELSAFKISSEECDERIDRMHMPGTLLMIRKKTGPRGSNISDLSRWKWGIVTGNTGKIIECVCPFKGDRFGGIDGIKWDLPEGISAQQFLSLPSAALPRAALPRPGDGQMGISVVRIDDAGLENQELTRSPVVSLTAIGKAPTPNVIVINKHGQICEPDGENMFLSPTSVQLQPVEAAAESGDKRTISNRDREVQYLSYAPQFFIGRTVFKRWSGDGKVYSGTVTETELIGDVGNEQVGWKIEWVGTQYEDDWQHFDSAEMERYCIDYVDGKKVQLEEKIEAVGTVDSGDGEQLDQKEEDPEPEPENQQFYATKDNDTWPDIIAEIESVLIENGEVDEFHDLDEQTNYYNWIFTEFQLGSDKSFGKAVGGVYFPNPIRKQEQQKLRKRAWPKFKVGTKFPIPLGTRWESYNRSRIEGMNDDIHEDEHTCRYLTALEMQGIEMRVLLDSEMIKSLCDNEELTLRLAAQVKINDMVDTGDVGIEEAKASSEYYDEKGHPIAPRNFRDLIKRNGGKQIWFDAMTKEQTGLDERGVFEYVTKQEIKDRGYPDPIDMQCLFDTKINPDGSFAKVKARSVLRGDMMIKGVHYSIVFTASPTQAGNRIIQGLIVYQGLTSMAADVKQAFTAADMQPSEKVAVRMAYGMRQYNEQGEELYGILKKNLYGSPLASRNWAKCRNDYLLKEMGKKENWKVQQMLYEPCMFIVTIDGRKTYMSCHTDDLDCACEDVRDCQAIFNKLNDEFGIEICNEKYMLGVNRDRWIENGISQNRLSQVAYIEEAWEDYGKYRKGKRAPMKPSDDMSWLEAVHGVVKEVEESEYERVKKRGYRSIVGTLLWPARNCYPVISWTCTQLCRCMEKPSEAAWESAVYCLHYLYSIKDEGITFRSDGNVKPVCYYDSGHIQDRVDYKSYYGYIIVWMGAPIVWMSKKHQHVGESSSEDEFMACNHAYKAVKWLRSLMTEMGLGHLFDEPTLLLGDNVAAGRWAMEDMITSGNRFIERMYFKVREGVQAGDVEARYINTKLNVSDILTKGAPREVIAVLHGMICGKVPWPDTPDAEGALRAQLLEMWRTRRHDIYFSR